MAENEQKQILEKVADILKMNTSQLQELIERISEVSEDDDGGFGCVTIIIKNGSVYKMTHTVEGKPRKLKH